MACLWEAGCLGVETLSATRRRGRPLVKLLAYFPGGAPRAATAKRLTRALRESGLSPLGAARWGRQADGRWVESWQKSLRPMPIGRRILALPEGCAPPARSRRIVIHVPFGQAFGTGEHASTRLSLRLLERHLRAGERVVDLGTGTGILAVAAHRLGAAQVLGVDDDPAALRVARETLRRNQLGGLIELCLGDASSALQGGAFDVALVNIGAQVIGRILPDLARALRPRGRAILAGILIDDEEDLAAAAARCGLVPREKLRARPWSALLLERPAG